MRDIGEMPVAEARKPRTGLKQVFDYRTEVVVSRVAEARKPRTGLKRVGHRRIASCYRRSQKLENPERD